MGRLLVAVDVLAANQAPDHVTIARFRVRHEQALAGFLLQSLRLCAAAGMVRLGVVALDGTKVAANAAERANRTVDKLEGEVAEILRQATEADQRDDREHDTREDELPAPMASKAGRLARLRVAKAQLEAEAAERQRRYEQRVAALAAVARARGKQPRARIRPRRRDEAPKPEAVANTTDPRQPPGAHPQGQPAGLQRPSGHHHGAGDRRRRTDPAGQRPPTARTDAGRHGGDAAAAGIAERPGTLLADCGYWTIANLTQLAGAPELLIPPARHGRQGKPRKDGKPSESRSDGLRAAMTARLQADDGKARYGKRKQTVEPVFGQIKDLRGARRFTRRGLQACQAEWKLLCGTHNLLKLWRHRATPRSTSSAAG